MFRLHTHSNKDWPVVILVESRRDLEVALLCKLVIFLDSQQNSQH